MPLRNQEGTQQQFCNYQLISENIQCNIIVHLWLNMVLGNQNVFTNTSIFHEVLVHVSRNFSITFDIAPVIEIGL